MWLGVNYSYSIPADTTGLLVRIEYCWLYSPTTAIIIPRIPHPSLYNNLHPSQSIWIITHVHSLTYIIIHTASVVFDLLWLMLSLSSPANITISHIQPLHGTTPHILRHRPSPNNQLTTPHSILTPHQPKRFTITTLHHELREPLFQLSLCAKRWNILIQPRPSLWSSIVTIMAIWFTSDERS